MQAEKPSGSLQNRFARSRRRPDSDRSSKFLVLAIVVVAVLGWSLSGDFTAGGRWSTASGGSSGLTVASSSQMNVLPTIAQIVNFTITGNTSGDSGPFDAAPSDTLVVFVESFGKTTVNNVTVEDGPNDKFVQEAYLLDYVNGGTHGFSVWACTNVSGGPNTGVNVTLKGGTTESAAIEVVDVNGGNPYGGNPIPFVDQVSDIIHGNGNAPNEHLTVHADDLALAGIGTWSWNNITALSPAALGDRVTTNSTVTGTNVTAGVLYYANNNSTAESVWMNATLTSRAPWIEDIITLGAVDYTTTYSVTFSATNLPPGTVWCQELQYAGPTRCGTSGSTWTVQNGTYAWNVSVESSANYFDPTLGNLGYIAVAGSSISLAFNFSDPITCHGACIQHVVVIVLENEPQSAISKYSSASTAWSEAWMSTHYEGTSTNDFSAACHPSAPNYLAMVAAGTNQCGSDSYPGTGSVLSGHGRLGSYENITLGDLLQNNTNYTGGPNFTWANYAEDLAGNACTDPAKYDTIQSTGKAGSALFFSKHAPFLYEQDTVYSTAFCDSHLLNVENGKYASTNATLPSFNTSVATGHMLNLSFITPNGCDDGHDVCTGGADTGPNASCSASGSKCTATTSSGEKLAIQKQIDPWLEWFVEGLATCSGSSYKNLQANQNCTREMKHTVFFILYDEGSGGPSTVSSGGLKSVNVPGEALNNNAWWCSGKKFSKSSYTATCGNEIYMVTVIPNGTLADNSTGDPTFFSHKISDYSMMATIEWLFGLDNTKTAHGKSGLGGLNNPSNLDALFAADGVTMESAFSFTNNGYD